MCPYEIRLSNITKLHYYLKPERYKSRTPLGSRHFSKVERISENISATKDIKWRTLHV